MGNLALIVNVPRSDLTLDPRTASQLAALGVTRVSLLRDEECFAVVLEGWAFDPDRSASAVETTLFGCTGSARVLRELAQMSLSGV